MLLWKRMEALVWITLVAGFSSACSGGIVSDGCDYGGKHYEPGDSFPDADGCNQCSCGDDGQIACTLRACLSDGCDYDGEHYSVGDTFPATDGCNQCGCQDDGNVTCTKKACDNACASIDLERTVELAKVQSCSTADECGQTISGSSCGCTRDLVARKDASLDHYLELQQQASETCGIGGSTCDCPPADGFACVNERCTWNYTDG